MKDMTDENTYLDLIELLRATAVNEFAAATGEEELQRRAILRYLKKGCAAGISTGELLDFLSISSPSILDRAGYSDSESEAIIRLVGEVSDEEVEREPI